MVRVMWMRLGQGTRRRGVREEMWGCQRHGRGGAVREQEAEFRQCFSQAREKKEAKLNATLTNWTFPPEPRDAEAIDHGHAFVPAMAAAAPLAMAQPSAARGGGAEEQPPLSALQIVCVLLLTCLCVCCVVLGVRRMRSRMRRSRERQTKQQGVGKAGDGGLRLGCGRVSLRAAAT